MKPEKTIAARAEEPKRFALTREWIPVAALAVLAVLYFQVAEPQSALSRFSFFVGLGLLPGAALFLLRRSSWSVFRICFALGLVAFVLDNPELRPDSRTLSLVLENWPLVLLGFAVSFTQPILGMLRTQRLLVDSGVSISRYDALVLCLSGSFFNIFLPGATGGDAYRVYAVRQRYGTRLAPAIASITLDRLLGLPSLILVVLLGMLLEYRFLLANRILAGLVPFMTAMAMASAVFIAYLMAAGRKRRRLPATNRTAPSGQGIRFRMKRIHHMIAANVTRPGTLPLALLYGFLAHMACIFSCMLFADALGVKDVPFLRYFLIVPMAMAINSIPGAPGGVGQGELAMATLLDMASPGDVAQQGVMVMLLFRISNLLIGLVGGAYYALGQAGADGKGHPSLQSMRAMEWEMGEAALGMGEGDAGTPLSSDPARTGEGASACERAISSYGRGKDDYSAERASAPLRDCKAETWR